LIPVGTGGNIYYISWCFAECITEELHEKVWAQQSCQACIGKYMECPILQSYDEVVIKMESFKNIYPEDTKLHHWLDRKCHGLGIVDTDELIFLSKLL